VHFGLNEIRDNPWRDTGEVGKLRRTPQEKKQISLQRDRVKDAWNLGKPWRKERHRRRARLERAYRHKVNEQLQYGSEADPDGVRRKQLYKDPGVTIGEHLAERTERQRKLEEEPRKSDAARQRRSWRRTS
jgi:hypothetical protein